MLMSESADKSIIEIHELSPLDALTEWLIHLLEGHASGEATTGVHHTKPSREPHEKTRVRHMEKHVEGNHQHNGTSEESSHTDTGTCEAPPQSPPPQPAFTVLSAVLARRSLPCGTRAARLWWRMQSDASELVFRQAQRQARREGRFPDVQPDPR